MNVQIREKRRFARDVVTYVCAVSAIVALSWPLVLSFDLWVLKDRGSFLNADVLLDEHLRLGVDTFYGYGLLPIFIQRVVFHAFGRSAQPMVGLTFVYLSALAVVCAVFRRRLPEDRIWTVALLALSPIVFWVNPTFPYCVVVLSMLFALLFVLESRYDLALAVSAVGCVSVPSLPLVLAIVLVVLIVVDWYARPRRNFGDLWRLLLPGFGTYVALVAFLTVIFGLRSTSATLTPLNQIGHYRAAHYDSVLTYLQIGKHALLWYFVNRVAWWMFATLVLLIAAALSARRALERRRLDSTDTFLIVVACVHVAFFAFAYGSGGQHVIYDPILVMGALVGLTRFTFPRAERYGLVVLLLLGVASDVVQIKHTVSAWRTTSVAPTTAGLYADRDWLREWNEMLAAYAGRKILVLSYGTALHVYFPQVSSPDLWNLDVAQLTFDDRRRLLAQVATAQVVVEDLTSPTGFVDSDSEIQAHLRAMCLASESRRMRIWRRCWNVSLRCACSKDARPSWLSESANGVRLHVGNSLW